jgi:hypothetical protein
MKSGIQTYRYFFLASYAFRSKVLVLVLVIVKKIRDPRSGIRKKFIPDPGGKKQRILDPDPQHCPQKSLLYTIPHTLLLIPILFIYSI